MSCGSMEGWKSKSNSSMVRRVGKCAKRSRAFKPSLAGGGGFLGDERGEELESVIARAVAVGERGEDLRGAVQLAGSRGRP